MSEHDYEELSLWQDILEEVINGRIDGHKCPHCKDKPVEAEIDEHRVYVRCTECGKWVEGIMPF